MHLLTCLCEILNFSKRILVSISRMIHIQKKKTKQIENTIKAYNYYAS